MDKDRCVPPWPAWIWRFHAHISCQVTHHQGRTLPGGVIVLYHQDAAEPVQQRGQCTSVREPPLVFLPIGMMAMHSSNAVLCDPHHAARNALRKRHGHPGTIAAPLRPSSIVSNMSNRPCASQGWRTLIILKLLSDISIVMSNLNRLCFITVTIYIRICKLIILEKTSG